MGDEKGQLLRHLRDPHAPARIASMDPHSFIIGLMAGITLFGVGILIAMIVLERPRRLLSCWPRLVSTASTRLRIWLELKGPRRKITEEWLQAEADHKQMRETVLEELERRKLARTGGKGCASGGGGKKRDP
jgi:hypothetical protein